ncbi:MAG: flagellar basal body rod protein FlgB [Betaproteobacteria bacterium]|nr:flagellar basal body rod protein FlgB [Betaproteobacteria bacterium]NBS47218.1 flagellar basal body rod protein FlgB [Betaproteobacteria bacterium]
MNDRMMSGLNLMSEALLLRAERQRMLSSNIANADTPGYAARDFDFNRALSSATGSTNGAGPVSLQASDARHIAPASGQRTPTAAQYVSVTQPSLDGNSVDLDRERGKFVDNAIRYESTLRFINSHVRTMLSAIQGQ